MRLIRAPESSQANSVSARRFPLAMASSRSVTPSAPRAPSSPVTMRSTSGHVLRGRAEAHAEEPGILVGDPFRPHRVGEAPSLADLLEQPTGQPPAEDVVEYGECVTARVVPVDRALASDDDVGLLGAPRSPGSARPGTRAPSASASPHPSRHPPARQARGHGVVLEVAGHGHHHVAGEVVGLEEGTDPIGGHEATDDSVPRTSRPSVWSGKRMAELCSAASSAGSSACIRISSRMTWRSASRSSGRRAGRHMMSDRMSSPRSTCSARSRM